MRSEAGLELRATPGWAIDLWAFDELAAGGPDDHRRLVLELDFRLCSQQLGRDDLLDEARTRLRATWYETALELLRAGHLPPVRLAERVLEIGQVTPALGRALGATLERSGEHALRARVRDLTDRAR